MAILVIGGTGLIGSPVVKELVARGADVRVLATRIPADGVPAGAELVTGDVRDVDFMRKLLGSMSTVFLLNPGTADELSRALLVLALLGEAGICRLVYLSMMGADTFADAPRAAAKLMTEHSIAQRGLPTTILRPNAAFQNDGLLRSTILDDHVYSTPLGRVGVTMVDARDIAEVAAIELLRRERSPEPLPTETIEVVGPDLMTGASMAALWSDVLRHRVTYTGDDLDAVEQAMRSAMPAAAAYDLKLVFRGILSNGVKGRPGAATRIADMLGRPLRRYRAFAEAMVAGNA